jgi:hypothetical protein
MKKLTPHHGLTPKGGRVATRTRRERPIYTLSSRPQAAADAPPLFFFPNIRRTRQRSW